MKEATEVFQAKPALRGTSHLLATVLALLGGLHLLIVAPPGSGPPVLVYVASLLALFGVSALYHKPMWKNSIRSRLRRLDHSTIFIFIAATYTPICLLALPHEIGQPLLAMVWICATLGVIKSLFWVGAPRLVTALLYVAMGWLAVGSLGALPAALGAQGVGLLFAGGAIYTLGAILYALKWPEPFPGIFGHHEVFHALVIVAAICHFTLIRAIVIEAV